MSIFICKYSHSVIHKNRKDDIGMCAHLCIYVSICPSYFLPAPSGSSHLPRPPTWVSHFGVRLLGDVLIIPALIHFPLSAVAPITCWGLLGTRDSGVNKRIRAMFSTELTIQQVKQCQIMLDSDNGHKENKTR